MRKGNLLGKFRSFIFVILSINIPNAAICMKKTKLEIILKGNTKSDDLKLDNQKKDVVIDITNLKKSSYELKEMGSEHIKNVVINFPVDQIIIKRVSKKSTCWWVSKKVIACVAVIVGCTAFGLNIYNIVKK